MSLSCPLFPKRSKASVAGSYAIEAPPRAGGLAGECNSVQVRVPAGDVVVAGIVILALFGYLW